MFSDHQIVTKTTKVTMIRPRPLLLPTSAAMLLATMMLLGLDLRSQAAAVEPFIVQFQWKYINYTWPDEETYQKAKLDEAYIERNNPIAGIKLWKGRMYLTIPRWRPGVPVTLASTPATPIDGQTAPKLEPYPNWDMQTLGDCNALQSVQSMEIDPKGRMWVIDTGRTAIHTLEATANCPPRLVILDLENDGAVLRSYPFPADVANPESAQLNDIAVDHEDGGYAYISDSDLHDPGIIVFSLKNRTSWKVSHESMRHKSDAVSIKVNGIFVTKPVPIDGIALSPASTEGQRTLYYSPLSSFSVFSIPTQVLRDAPQLQKSVETGRAVVGGWVRNLGIKPSQSDGMIMSNSGVLYFGLLGDDAVSMWDTRNPSFTTAQRIISRDHALMQWPDTFAFDEQGKLWLVTNRLQTFLTDTVNIKEPNFRVIMSKINQLSYQYYENGTAPELPDIPAGAPGLAARSSLALAVVLVALQLFIWK